MELDSAGGAVTGGLVAGAIEKPGGHAGEDHGGPCTDCGAETSGRFCSNCGQPTHVHRTLGHLVHEVLHGVLHFDGRIWRTLPLLVLNPGQLTREWVHGKRTRYVSPLAMFLFTVFLMFFVWSFSGGLQPKVTESSADEIAETRQELAEAKGVLASNQAVYDQALRKYGADNRQTRVAKTGVDGAALAVRLNEQKLARQEGRLTEKRTDGLQLGSWQAEMADSDVEVNLGNARLNEAVKKKLKNPDLALYKVQQTLYKFAFLLVPLSIPFVWLLFAWKRGFSLYDHGVFVLYSLTAMAMLFMVVSVIGPLWRPLGFFSVLLVSLGIPAHMFAQLKGAYGLSWFSAAWRTVMLLFFSQLVLGIFFLIAILLGLTG